MTDYIKLEVSKNRVKKSGKILSNPLSSDKEKAAARNIVSQFRSAHQYPMLSIANNVRNVARTVNPDNAIIAQRLKRLPTIIDKLERHPDMNVVTMQDLGGCRVILPPIEEVFQLRKELKNQKRSRNIIKREYDYLNSNPGPQKSGYRGIHLVYGYMASKEEYQGYQVELQIRTALEHSWATAVETIDLFSGNRIKYSSASEEYIRYFVLVSSLMALEEGSALVPGTTSNMDDLIHELFRLERKLNILQMLESYKAVVNEHSKSNKKSYLTLELDRDRKNLNVNMHKNISEAESRINEIELEDDSNIDAVLINVGKIDMLRGAYPNYFADTEKFSNFVNERIANV